MRLYAKDIKKAAKKLEKPIKGDIINLDTTKLKIIYKEDLLKTKLVTDNKGNTKEIVIRPKKVLI